MKITIDTVSKQIIVPNDYYKQIDEQNANLAKFGASSTKIDYLTYLVDCFAESAKNPIITVSESKAKRKK